MTMDERVRVQKVKLALIVIILTIVFVNGGLK